MWDTEVIGPGEVGVKQRSFEDGAYPFAGFVAGGQPKPAVIAGGGANYSKRHAQSGRFPASIGAQDAVNAAFRDGQTQVVHRSDSPKFLGEAVDCKYIFHSTKLGFLGKGFGS